MRTTVGSLPSSVYWRRRAVVLGALLLGIIVLFVSCSGGGDDDKRGSGSPSSQLPTPAPATTSATPSPDESFADGVPGGINPSRPAPGDLETQPPGGVDDDAATLQPTGDGQNANVTAQSDGTCADTEISLTPIPADRTIRRGSQLQIQLQIKNIGDRVCSRDVGADPQELYIDSGAQKFWSSDTCGTAKGSNVRQLQPGSELSFKVTWNGRQTSACQGGMPSGPNPPDGTYQLRGRLGTLLSNPVTLTING